MDIEFYKKAYKDVSKLSHGQIVKHYKIYGIKEKRYQNINEIKIKLGPLFDNYDYDAYIKNNSELKGLNYEQALIHFCDHGRYENRIFFSNKNDVIKNVTPNNGIYLLYFPV